MCTTALQAQPLRGIVSEEGANDVLGGERQVRSSSLNVRLERRNSEAFA